MIDWQDISTADEVKASGEWVLLDGGYLEDQWDDDEADRPVVARWAEFSERHGYRWFVCGFDSGSARLWYDEPKRWARLT